MKKEMGDIFCVLLLFFCMTVISLVMVFSKFDSAAEEFWSEQSGAREMMGNFAENDIFDLDNTKTVGGVDEIKENSTLSK